MQETDAHAAHSIGAEGRAAEDVIRAVTESEPIWSLLAGEGSACGFDSSGARRDQRRTAWHFSGSTSTETVVSASLMFADPAPWSCSSRSSRASSSTRDHRIPVRDLDTAWRSRVRAVHRRAVQPRARRKHGGREHARRRHLPAVRTGTRRAERRRDRTSRDPGRHGPDGRLCVPAGFSSRRDERRRPWCPLARLKKNSLSPVTTRPPVALTSAGTNSRPPLSD